MFLLHSQNALSWHFTKYLIFDNTNLPSSPSQRDLAALEGALGEQRALAMEWQGAAEELQGKVREMEQRVGEVRGRWGWAVMI